MMKTWGGGGDNELLNRQRNRKQVSVRQRPYNSKVTQYPAEISNIFNHYFASIGPRVSHNISPPRKNLQDYLAGTNHYKSFFFDPFSSSEVDLVPCVASVSVGLGSKESRSEKRDFFAWE